MTNLQKAIAYIAEANYAAYFALMNKVLGKNNALSTLENEYFYQGVTPNFPQRLETFARTSLATLPTAHKFLTNCTKPAEFVGRETELVKLHTLLDEGKKSVIVNGLGGIGKTSLALQYVWQYKEHYHHIVWVEQQSSLLLAFMTEKKLNELVAPEKEEAEVYFHRLMQFLAATEGKNLLVIDNYEDTEADKTIAILTQIQNVHFAHWRVLFTSREKVNGFALIALDTLPKDEAIALFKLHSENRPFDENVLVQVLEEVDYHTLTIELLSKIYANDVDVTLTNLLTVLQQKDFDNELVQEMVTTKHHKGEANLYKHLLLLFNMEKWTADEQHLLKQFAALPSLPIKATQLFDWLQNNRQTYKTALKNLTRKGWLSTTDQENYTMHRLLKMLIQKHLGVIWEDVKTLVESIKKEVKQEKIEANPLALKPFIAYIESFLANINVQNDEVEKSFLYHTLGNLKHYAGIYEQAELHYTQAQEIVEKHNGTKSTEYADILSDLANVYSHQGKYKEAITLLQKALQIIKERLGEKHPEYAISLNNLALAYGVQGKYDKAIPLHQEALQIRKEVLGEKHPEHAYSLNNLANVYHSQGKYGEAIPLYQEALQIWKKALGEKHPNYATTLHNLAHVYEAQGKYEEATVLYQEALQIRKEVLGEKHPDYAMSLNNLAFLYCNQGKHERTIALYQECLHIQKEVLGEKHPYYANSLCNLGNVYYKLQNYEQALILLQDAYPVLLNTLGDENILTKKCKGYLDKTLQALQNKT
jgi:tetratricopeptide (TPR) repeat protein